MTERQAHGREWLRCVVGAGGPAERRPVDGIFCRSLTFQKTVGFKHGPNPKGQGGFCGQPANPSLSPPRLALFCRFPLQCWRDAKPDSWPRLFASPDQEEGPRRRPLPVPGPCLFLFPPPTARRSCVFPLFPSTPPSPNSNLEYLLLDHQTSLITLDLHPTPLEVPQYLSDPGVHPRN